ncbi:hypothetical protein LOD99_12962 [Oopsacas minuta]|uniref:cystathionine gamma-lyase n=1 Tax=Oopsacas minuta TaxID=111878 RepID=A0AAV7JAH1_9METZ|nr:hypothetical protein LOD99_12962 [Oopsacas minuta]
MSSNQSENVPEFMKHFGTNAIHAGHGPDQWNCKAVMPPIFTATTFKQHAPGDPEGGYDYTRGGNPTRTSLQTCLAKLENAKYAYVYSSGMAATSTVATAVLRSGSRILAMNDLYGGTNRYFRRVIDSFNVTVDFVDASNLEKVKNALTPQTSLVWLESPTNPTLTLVDIAAIVQIAKSYPSNPVVVVDNTFMSSYFQQPLSLGADVSMQSLTKYMNGHTDVLMGALVTNRQDLADKFEFIQMSVGAVPSPYDCYLTIRGLKTLHIRMREHQRNALAVAEYLKSHKEVELVLYPGLPSHPQHELAKRQCYGFSGMVSFRMKGNAETTKKFLKHLKVFTLAESLGGCGSLIEVPSIMTHKSVPEEQRNELGITDTLMRLSIGLEETEDIIEDLATALKNAI